MFERRRIACHSKLLFKCECGHYVAHFDENEEEHYTIPIRGASLTIRGGEMVAVTGSVGSGKSTLLAACWGEALVHGGYLACVPDVAVVLAKPFVVAGTIEENILVGRDKDEARLRRVIAQCALADDLKQLPHAEQTLVGCLLYTSPSPRDS